MSSAFNRKRVAVLLTPFLFAERFKQLDYAYIRPHLIREKKHHEPKIFETYSKLTLQDAIEFARRNPSSWMVHGTNSFANFINNEAVTNVPPAKYGYTISSVLPQIFF